VTDARTGRETPAAPVANTAGEILSQRLMALLDDMLAGRAPNAGRFCGYCYHPLAPERQMCPHCGRSSEAWPVVASIPRDVIDAFRQRRSREGLVVRAIAWGGLTIGVSVALVPVAFAGITWWSALAFFGLLGFFYLLSANMANSVGDELGYRWGRAVMRRRWQRFLAQRDGGG